MPKVRKIDPPPNWDDEDEDDEDEDEEDEDDEYEGGWYPPSRPIRRSDGIKARTQRGNFGESWWSKRWIAALERLGMGSRLQRGRSYARGGQVLEIEIAPGAIKAKVQGSRSTPYKVTIKMRPLTDAEWDKATSALAQQAIFAAKLLAGEMPQNIEEAFDAVGVPLFPQSARDLVTDCSCPDFANPCKHTAAVYYLLGERFDEDPFLIFAMRGRTREQIIAALRAQRADEVEAESVAPAPVERAPALAELLATFYVAGEELDAITPRIAAPAVEASLLRRLGPAPADANDGLRELYKTMSSRAIERVFGEDK